MTQYKQVVEEYQAKMKAEEWGKQIKHIHARYRTFGDTTVYIIARDPFCSQERGHLAAEWRR